MALVCNISRKGRWSRGICGAMLLVIAIILASSGWPTSAGLRWTIVGVGGLVGAFQIFEACVGWCVVRAFGGKTPI